MLTHLLEGNPWAFGPRNSLKSPLMTRAVAISAKLE